MARQLRLGRPGHRCIARRRRRPGHGTRRDHRLAHRAGSRIPERSDSPVGAGGPILGRHRLHLRAHPRLPVGGRAGRVAGRDGEPAGIRCRRADDVRAVRRLVRRSADRGVDATGCPRGRSDLCLPRVDGGVLEPRVGRMGEAPRPLALRRLAERRCDGNGAVTRCGAVGQPVRSTCLSTGEHTNGSQPAQTQRQQPVAPIRGGEGHRQDETEGEGDIRRPVDRTLLALHPNGVEQLCRLRVILPKSLPAEQPTGDQAGGQRI